MKLLVVGSQTRAARAQELLEKAGIRAGRKKLTETGEGCMHAVVVDDSAANRAVGVLEGAGIRIKSVVQQRG